MIIIMLRSYSLLKFPPFFLLMHIEIAAGGLSEIACISQLQCTEDSDDVESSGLLVLKSFTEVLLGS